MITLATMARRILCLFSVFRAEFGRKSLSDPAVAADSAASGGDIPGPGLHRYGSQTDVRADFSGPCSHFAVACCRNTTIGIVRKRLLALSTEA